MNLFFIMHDPNIISRFIQSAVDNTAEQNGLTYQIQKKLNLNCGPHKCSCMQIENSVLISVQAVMLQRFWNQRLETKQIEEQIKYACNQFKHNT